MNSMKLPVIQPGQVVYEPPEEFEQLLDWVGNGLANLETIEDEQLREQVFALLQGVDMLHRQGLDRMLRLMTTLGGRGLTERVIQDGMVKTLLDLYDLPEYQESDPW